MNLTSIVEQRLAELEKKSFHQLAMLPSFHGERTEIAKRKVLITVWKDEVGVDELRIVVQAYRHQFLGIGTMEAQGFRINRSGAISEVRGSEIFEFR